MGISRLSARCLLNEARQRPFHGCVLQLGKQDINFGMNELREWASASEVTLNERASVTLKPNPQLPGRECIDDFTFFTQLGFDNVESCDTSAYENAQYIFDMNHPSPEELNGRFDMILNGGTLEHVFQLPQALCNVHHMLKVGGRAIHIFPVSNYVDHGFYSFSPTLFCDYYEANRYQIESCFLTGQTLDPFAPFALFHYQPGCVDHLSFGGFSGRIFGKYDIFDGFFVARKLPESTADAIPVQRKMAVMWRNGGMEVATLRQFRLLGYL